MNTIDMLKVAHENKFAIGAFNIGNSEFVKIVLEAAEEEQAPVILQIHPFEIDVMTDSIVEYIKDAALRASVPVGIHLDHGGTMKDIMRAIRNGYTSVMIDASHMDYEDNVAASKAAAELAHLVNVSVEAELGTIGNNEGSGEGSNTNIIYTDPELAADFVQKTGIDFLAVAIGTSHGIYTHDSDKSLKIDLLKEINEKVGVPLVLHGGSDNNDDEIRAAVQNGVAKINLASDMKRAFYTQFKESMNEQPTIYDPWVIQTQATEAGKQMVKHKMELFGSVNKVKLFK